MILDGGVVLAGVGALRAVKEIGDVVPEQEALYPRVKAFPILRHQLCVTRISEKLTKFA